MAIDHSSGSMAEDDPELLYLWALGDLHFWTEWNALHAQRLQTLFQDLNTLWGEQSLPVFCVLPGDLIERGTVENYALAKSELTRHLHGLPFYPGIGNHEYYPGAKGMDVQIPEDFTRAWNKPTRYFWLANGVLCMMLDQPSPMLPDPVIDNPVYLSDETLAFLRTTLSQYPDHPAIIFAHCPLQNTVLDRDPALNLDYDSQESFFRVENSDEVRAILAEHAHHGALYISGHTHSGWGSPNLVYTETLGDHPVTHVNLMSPWYTGRRGGARLDPTTKQWSYRADEPNVQISFAIHVHRSRVVIRAREHLSQSWLAEWTVPLQSVSSVSPQIS